MAAHPERHLAAVMFTDIVGYTALMQEDEESARVIRERHRDVVEGAITGHGGTLVQFFGDGTLSVFRSASEAVAAAVQLQEQLQTYPKIPLRVGIELGEIAYDAQGAYGDAVNVAARIESLGTAGSVLISSSVRGELNNQPGVKVVRLGEVGLKNVAEPVEIFAVDAPRLTIPTPEEVAARGLPVHREQSAEPAPVEGAPRRTRVASPLVGVLAAIGALALLTVVTGLWGTADAAPPTPPIQRQATFVGNVVEASVSPGGDLLAYTTNQADGMRLMVQDAATGTALEVASSTGIHGPDWSPDGRLILVSVASGATEYAHWAYPRLGGDPVAVSPIKMGQSQWSADGERVFVWGQDPRLYVNPVGSDTFERIVLADSTSWLHEVAPHPDGDALAVLQRARGGDENIITLLYLEGAQRVEEPTERWSGALIPSTEILVEDGAVLASLTWAPDGRWLYYLREDQSAFQLLRIRPQSGRRGGGTPDLLASGLEFSPRQVGDGASLLSITEDGERLFYVKGRSFSNLWSVRTDGDGWAVEPSTTGTALVGVPSISPDGRRVLYKSTIAGRSNVFVMPANGGSPRQLTHVDSVSGHPAWSPDGQSFAFGIRRGGENRVATASVDGPADVRVFETTFLSGNGVVEWAPGREILYQRPGLRNLHFLDPVTGTERPLLSPDSASTGFALKARYSPDGRQLALLWNRSQDRAGVYFTPLPEVALRRLDADPYVSPLGWSADARTVFVLSQDRRAVLAVPVDGGNVDTVSTLPFTVDVHGTTHSGEWFMVSAPGSTGDVWTIEN